MRKATIFILFTVMMLSCTSQDEEAFKFDLSGVFDQINFDKPEVGQVSNYIYFNGLLFGDAESSIEYSGDLSISFHAITQDVHSEVNYIIGNRSFGIVRTSFFNSNSISGHGWDLQLGN